ncbi:MAG TPA: sodium-dependent transporter [Caulobacteraceae bacterium]|jgi:NSS family neurotransmitter:Na+ symporter
MDAEGRENRNSAVAEAHRGDVWTSRFAFLYAAAAAAIGLGSLWRFPYVAGANGGGAFVLLYLLFVFALCVPLMLAEMWIGRRGHGSAVASVAKVIADERAWRGWKLIGWLSILIPFLGLSYYSVVAGWGLDYARVAIASGFGGFDAARSLATFDNLVASPVRQGLLQFLFIAGVATVVALGVRRGIEVVSRIKMIALAVILLGLVAHNAVAYGLAQGGGFLFVPDFGALTPQAVLTALGQALFSTAIGVGVMMTYSAYLPKGSSLPQSALIINGAVAVVAMLAGLAIFPIVFAFGLKPAEGPNLIFVTLPVAFGQMPGGRLVGIAFFVLIVLGAFTTAVGMLEPVVAWLKERIAWSRPALAAAAGLVVFAIGLPSLLSFNVLKDFHPLAGVPGLGTLNVFDFLDQGIANILLPLNALLIALFVGWAVARGVERADLGMSGATFGAWRLALRFLAPIAIIGLMVSLIS